MIKQLITIVFLLVSLVGYSNSQVLHVLSASRPGVPLVDIRNSGSALNLDDDNVSAAISLPFQFELFGNRFNSVWVSNNGVISFNNGNISGYNSRPLNQLSSDYNYSLFPLWTDLINQTEQNPYVSIRNNTAIFGWYNTREFTNRYALNSFEVQIWDNNSFEFRYGSINLPRQSFTIGYTGNISSREYVQWARSPGGGFSAENFSYYSDSINQCQINPLYNINCEGYAQAYLQQQCNINVLSDSRCSGYEQAILEQACAANPLHSSQCSGYAAAYFAQRCQQNPLYNNQCPGYRVAFARNIASNVNQSAALELQAEPTKNSIEPVSNNNTGDISLNDVSKSLEQKNTDKDTQGPGLNFRTAIALKNAIEATNASISRAIETSRDIVLDQNQQTMEFLAQLTVNNSDSKEGNLSNPINLNQASNQRTATVVNNNITPAEQRNSSAATAPSELAGGADFNAFSQTTPAFNAYLGQRLRDNAFYPPREVYRNQQPVDNRNALRLLNGASDRLHRELVDQQYGR